MCEVRYTPTPSVPVCWNMIIITYIAAPQSAVYLFRSRYRPDDLNLIMRFYLFCWFSVLSLSQLEYQPSLGWQSAGSGLRSLAVYDYQRNISHLELISIIPELSAPLDHSTAQPISHSYFSIRINLSVAGKRWGRWVAWWAGGGRYFSISWIFKSE